MATHSDPTAARATGNIQKEWIDMVVLALRIRRSPDRDWAEEQERRFTGIYRRFLTDSEEELLAEIPERVRKKRGV